MGSVIGHQAKEVDSKLKISEKASHAVEVIRDSQAAKVTGGERCKRAWSWGWVMWLEGCSDVQEHVLAVLS